MYKIILKNMAFFAFHGVLKPEKELGQKFYIDIEVFLNIANPSSTDDINDTVDYSKLYSIAKHFVEDMKFNLIETLAQKIMQEIQNQYEKNIDLVTVRVRKPSAPIPGIFDYVEVEVRSDSNGC